MRMLLYSCLITIALMCSPYVALGDAQSHRKAAENLLLVMEVDKSLPKIAAQVVEKPAPAKSPARSAAGCPAEVSDEISELGECQGGHDHCLYPRIHRARVEETDGILQDPRGEESQRENAPARVNRGTDWSQESPGESNGATADARRPEKQTGWRRLTVITPVLS
jgi:hypothetical protein